MMIVEISYRCKLDCYYIETSRPSFPNYGGIFAQHYSRDLLYTLNADLLIQFLPFTSEAFKDENPLTFGMSFLKKVIKVTTHIEGHSSKEEKHLPLNY